MYAEALNPCGRNLIRVTLGEWSGLGWRLVKDSIENKQYELESDMLVRRFAMCNVKCIRTNGSWRD